MADKPRLGTAATEKKKEEPAVKKGIPDITEQEIFDQLHGLLMRTKVSHYATRSYAAHKALDRTYKGIDDLADSISEQIIGYSSLRPEKFQLGTIDPMSPDDLGSMIINFAGDLEKWAEHKCYCNIGNLAQELSGVGAELRYLATLT